METIVYKERLVDITSQNVFILYFIIGLILIAWLLVLDRKKIKSYFGAFIGRRFVDQIERSDYEKSTRLNVVSRLIYFANISMLIFKLFESVASSNMDSGLKLLGEVFIVVVLWFLIKFLIVSFLCWIFKVQELAKETVFYNQINSLVLGLVLFPIILFSHYQKIVPQSVFVYFCFILIIIGAFSKGIRLFTISFNRYNLSLYHNILYICTLEILPLIVLIKLLIGSI